ncbi:MAG TPA: hypothetical protein VE085_09680 [Burkholderiales bacterium]|nr:hypothetical protein [Burkholderiales bacterium]
MNELRLIERAPLSGSEPVKLFDVPEQPVQIQPVAQGDLLAVTNALSTHGAYLAEERRKGRRSSTKSVAETTILIVEDDPDQLAGTGPYSVQPATSRNCGGRLSSSLTASAPMNSRTNCTFRADA